MPAADRDTFDQQLARLIGHYHPGRNPDDFSEWGGEIRRAFGDTDVDVLVRAVSLWKLNQERLPIIATFKDYITEARKQLQIESERLLPPPDPAVRAGKKPPPDVLEWHLCKGVAQARIWQGGGSSTPSDEQINEVMLERRARGIPVGDMRFQVRTMKVEWKSAEEILRERREAGTLTPRIEEHLRELVRDRDQRDAPAPGQDRPSGEPPSDGGRR